MRRWKILLATVLLAAGLCACEKADPVEPARVRIIGGGRQFFGGIPLSW